MTLSLGYAVGFEGGKTSGHDEWMLSLKVLR